MYRREVTAAMAVALAVIALTFLLPGCGKLKNQGEAPPNFAPEVYLANIPIDSSAFLANPEIHWYATDRDGYITKYRYKVVTFANLPKDNGNVCPDCYVEASKQDDFADWTVIVVADVPVSTSGTVRLFAADNPDSFVSQCFFIQAEDNFGARSDVVYRVFKRANHLPDTRVQLARGPYIAGTCSPECTQISGISVQWEGSDLLDYPGKQPDFEYEWEVYGPFDGEMVNDSTLVVDTNGIIWENFLVDHSWNRDSTDVWTTQKSASLSRLFRGVGSTGVTLSGYFVFKVRARDDAYAPDPTPAIAAFEAIQPGCERGILLIDNSNYTNKSPGQLWGDCTYQHCDDFNGNLTTERYFPYWEHLFEAAGYPLDTIYHRVKGGANDIPPARDLITKYRLVVLLDESYLQSYPYNLSWYERLAEYMDIGGKVMVFGRNQFARLGDGDPRVAPITFSTIPLQYFTLEGQFCAIWINSWLCFKLPPCSCDHSNEEFIGAGSLVGDLPDIRVDFDRLVETEGGAGGSSCEDGRPWNHDYWNQSGPTPFTPYPYRGIPAVNFYESTGAGEGLYLAYSVYGSEGYLNGGVCGVRYDTGCFKSSIFSFPLWEINEDDAIALISAMIEWYDIQ